MGAKSADLPVMQPAKFEQVINVQKGGALARREYARYGEQSVRMIVEEWGRPTEPAQPPAEDP
jgi:hypothetical protein